MANSTWFQLTNEALGLAGLDLIEDEDSFNSDEIPKYADTCKRFIKLGHQMMSVRVFRHFNERLIPVLMQADQSDYQLDTGISPESITVRSFFLSSPDAPQSSLNSEIRNWKWEEYMRAVPDPTTAPTGAPGRWILLPLNRTDLTPVHQVRFYPTPNDSYTAYFKAKLNPYPLTQAASIVTWPTEYEHVLTTFAWDLLERDLGEGKEGAIKQMADRALAEVKLVSGVPQDVRKAPQSMRLPSRRAGNYNRYNSPISVDPNTGAILD